MRLKDKVVVVTGAAQGIGLAIAERFVREGARVVVGDVNAEIGEAAAKRLRDAGAEALFHRADVGFRDQAEALIARAGEAFGRIDILVNNAGVTHKADFLDLKEEDFDRVLRTNLKSAFLCGQGRPSGWWRRGRAESSSTSRR